MTEKIISKVIGKILDPSAEFLGQELKEIIESRLKSAPAKIARKKERNTEAHLESIAVRLNKQRQTIFEGFDDPEQLELFSDCFDHIADIQPEYEELSALWQSLLCQIGIGNCRNKILLESLKKISPIEATLLFSFKAGARISPRDNEAKYYLSRLIDAGLVRRDWEFLTLSISVVTIIMSVLNAAINIASISHIIGINLMVLGVFLAIPRMRPTWLGQELLFFAKKVE